MSVGQELVFEDGMGLSLARLLEEVKGDPFGTGIKLIIKLAFLGFGLLFAAVAAVVIYGIITG